MKKLLAILALVPSLAFSQPITGTVKTIIGFAPGSGNEIAFRKASSIVEKNNPGVNFVVENRPGADSVIAQNALFTAPANGMTISVPSHMSLFVTNDIWQRDVKKFNYSDFENVITLGQSPLALVAKTTSLVDTPVQFLATVKSSHRNINVAVGGGAHQMAYEYIMLQLHADRNKIQAVRYPGPAQAVTAVAGDKDVEFGIMPIAIARPLIEAGKVKLIGLTGNRVPEKIAGAALLEDSIPGISVYAGWMISLPPHTPKEITKWYQQEFSKAIRTQEYQNWARDNYILIAHDQLTPGGVAAYAKQLRTSFQPIITKLQQ